MQLQQNPFLFSIMSAPALFTPEECLRIIQKSEIKNTGEGGVVGQVNKSIRETVVSELEISEKNRWIGDKILPIITSMNEKTFHFDIYQLQELNLLEYNPGCFYDWHYDIVTSTAEYSTRKLSFIVFLSHPDDYRGGRLSWEYSSLTEEKSPVMEQGTMIVFPSYMMHKVNLVTSGKRYTLAGWIHGNAFR